MSDSANGFDMLWRRAAFVTQLVAASAGIVKKAGHIIRNTTGNDLKVIVKGYKDFQTEADRAAQTCIVGNLRRRFGNDLCIIGEEDQDHGEITLADDSITDAVDSNVLTLCENRLDENLKDVDQRDVVVWVDPLDGTSEFTEGLLDHVTVLIGIAVKGEPVGGVIYQPFYGYNKNDLKPDQWGRVIWGVKGYGAHGVTPSKPPSNKRIVVTTRSHSDKLVNAAIDALKPDEVVRVGGAGHKVLLVIEGLANAYVFASGGCKKWDTCAPAAILHALGGRLTDMSGRELRYHRGVQYQNSGGVLATPPGTDHDWYVDHIPTEVKNALPPLLY